MAQSTIPEEATKEQIDEYVDQISSEVEEERKGDEKSDEKSDAQITSEHADNEKKPAAEDSGDETADEEGDNVPHDDGEKTGKAKSDWRKEAKTEAAAYGIGDEELAEFQSREELDRALKLFDRQLDSERKTLASEGEKDKKVEKPTKGEAAETKDGRYEVRLDPDVYDDEIVAEFTALRDHYESRLEILEERFATADALAEEQRFDRSIDALEFSQLFGKTGEESKDELERRGELFDQVKIEQELMSRLGRNVSYDTLVQRAARSIFSEEYDKRLLKNHTRKISKQSDKRQGDGATRPTDPRENPRDEADRLYKEIEGA